MSFEAGKGGAGLSVKLGPPRFGSRVTKAKFSNLSDMQNAVSSLYVSFIDPVRYPQNSIEPLLENGD